MNQYTVKKVNADNVPIESELWGSAQIAHINKSLWAEEFPYNPNTTAKLLYSDNGITILLETDESPLVATFTNMNDPVCRDSCMEFFIQPDINDTRYLNFELNPFGTLYLGLGSDRCDSKKHSADTKIFNITSKITEGKWQLKWYIPFDFLKLHFNEITNPFRGNLYKCGDETGHQHYRTWNEIDLPAPDYHCPKFFGEFYFDTDSH